MSGIAAQKGFIYQTIIAMLECLERDDWDRMKLEPDTVNHLDKIDIQLYLNGKVIKAIQVKSSGNKFSQPEVEKWLEAAKLDASDADEVSLYLVGDSYTSNCEEYIKSSSEIKTYPYTSLDFQCRQKLQNYIAREGRCNQVDEDDLRVAYNNLFAEIHNNSISPTPFSREEFREWLKRVISFSKCLTDIPSINRNVGLIGRDAEFCKVREMLDKDGCIALVSGLGGIGKTAVMRWICNSIKEDGDAKNHVAWVTCGASLQTDLLLLRESLGIAEGSSDNQDYQKIINKLRNFRGTLYLFMDNMTRIPDSEEKKVLNSLQPNVHIMITARHRIEDIPCVELDTLEPELALTMFYKYYNHDLDRRYETSARMIVDTVHRHTLLVELLARAAAKSGGTLEDFRHNLEEKGFFDVFLRPISTKHDEYLTIEDSIIKLYEISGLTEHQKHIMRLFSIFTPEREIYWKVAEWAGFDMQSVDELADRAWLGRGGLENGFFIHQIISDSLRRQIGNGLNLEEYGNLLNEVIHVLNYLYDTLPYQIVQERLTLPEDVLRYLETNTNRSSEEMNNSQDHLDSSDFKAVLYHNLGSIYEKHGIYQRAGEYLEKAIAIETAGTNAISITTAKSYVNAANVYRQLCNYEKAVEYIMKALDIVKVLPEELLDFKALAYNNLALTLSERGDENQALEYYRKALDIYEQLQDDNQSLIAFIFNNMALVYTKQKNYNDAIKYFQKALDIREHVLGINHPDTATTYHTIGEMLIRKGDYQKALEYCEKALAVRLQILGPDHPDTGMAYNHLATIFYNLGQTDKALEYYRKDIAIIEKSLGSEHPETAQAYCILASAYYHQNDCQNALYFYRKACVIREKVLGNSHPDTANVYVSIGRLLEGEEQDREALVFFLKALRAYESVLGTENNATVETYSDVTRILYKMKDYERALDYCLKTLHGVRALYGENHANTKTVELNAKKLKEIITMQKLFMQD